MKKYVLSAIVLVLAAAFFLIDQTAETKPESRFERSTQPQVSRAIAFAESSALRYVASSSRRSAQNGSSLRLVATGHDNGLVSNSNFAHDADESIATFGSNPMPAPGLSVPGLTNLDNGLIYNLLFIPPDMTGDVGPDHFVQVVNSLLRIYNKNGQPLSDPFKISDVFAQLGTTCSTRNDGLANVLYDTLADRWLISQTCTAFPPFRQMLAVSKTGDPLGQYYAYEFVMPNVKLNDFPKFGVWPDGYYMSTDEYLGSDYVGAGAFAFDRMKILAGDATASYVYFNLPVPPSPRRRGLLPADLDGLRPPPQGASNVFASYTATEYGDPQDAIRLYDFHADFNDPFGSTFTERTESPLVVAAFDPTSPDGRPDISQPLPGEKLDSQSDRINYRLAYRNLGTSESLVVTQNVRMQVADPYRAGVRVYELRKTGANYAVTEQATIGDNLSSHWIAAAAQDNQGNLAVQYNVVADDKKPSILYTGKLATEPAGQFRPERALIDGTGVQKAFGWRWGEYAGMSVDPVDDCTFWMTNAYYTLESEMFSDFGWLTRIGNFKFAECTPAPRASITGVITNTVNSQPVSGAIVRATAYTRASNAAGNYGSLSVLPGSYQVTVSARGYVPQTISVTVANGDNVTRNFSLQPIPVIENTAVQLTAESCSINHAPEPGETVTFDVAFQNTGVLAASNLTITLLASSAVVSPSAPQSYGTMPAGGAAVARPFSFTIGNSVPCGGVVGLTFEIRDNGTLIGTISVPLQTGVQRVALQQNFDGVRSPALPNGWTTSSTENHQLWVTSGARTQSQPNALYSLDPHQRGENQVVTPSFPIFTPEAEIQFRNWYELETTFLRNRLYDGSVLEIKIGEGEWQDIIAAGGLFLSGGYDGTIDSCCQNPLAGRAGWSGRSGINQVSEFITTRAKLPASAAGQSVQLRFRIGTDIGGFREGQYIDDLRVKDGYYCECQTSGRARFDFDGDRRTDLSVFDLNSGANPDFRVVRSGTNQASETSWGNTDDVPAIADFDGDGKSDYSVYRPSEGSWYVLRSSDGGFIATRFGLSSDLVTPADFDGDGKSDIAVFRPSTGVWYVLRSSNGQVSQDAFGLNGDKPVNDDYDGDGRSDIAVYRPSNGTWYVQRTSNGAVDINAFGLSADVPVSGDYDGDGRADLAVFRPSTGVWYFLATTAGFSAVQFGLTGDIPMQADFDGDARADISVFRPSSKAWYHLRSSDGGFSARQFGSGSERPVPGVFVDR